MFCLYTADGSYNCSKKTQNRVQENIEGFENSEEKPVTQSTICTNGVCVNSIKYDKVCTKNERFCIPKQFNNEAIFVVNALQLYNEKEIQLESKVSKWGNFSVSETAYQPTLTSLNSIPFVKFTKDSFMKYEIPGQVIKIPYNNNATFILVCRFNEMTQFNRAISTTYANTGGNKSSVFEWILQDGSIRPLFFYRNNQDVIQTAKINITKPQFAVYMYTVTNGLDEFFVNGVKTNSVKNSTPLSSCNVQSILLGSIGSTGNATDFFYAALHPVSFSSEAEHIYKQFQQIVTELNRT